MMVGAIASRTTSDQCPARAGPFFARELRYGPPTGGRCNRIVKRVVRSTSVPIAELPRRRIKSPSRRVASNGNSLQDYFAFWPSIAFF